MKKNINFRKSSNPFQEDFTSSYEEQDNPLAQTVQNIRNDKFLKKVLGTEHIENETALES